MCLHLSACTARSRARPPGKMEMPDLLRVWSAVPREKLHALDSKLAKAPSCLLHMLGLLELCQALRSAPKVDEMPLQSAFLQQNS